MRAFGLDVHRDFCEVAIAEGGVVRSAGRIATRVDSLELFAQGLLASDTVALEATTGADKIVSLLQAQGIRVVCRQHPQAEVDHGGEGEDRPARRPHAGAAAGLGAAR
jgi:transposase